MGYRRAPDPMVMVAKGLGVGEASTRPFRCNSGADDYMCLGKAAPRGLQRNLAPGRSDVIGRSGHLRYTLRTILHAESMKKDRGS